MPNANSWHICLYLHQRCYVGRSDVTPGSCSMSFVALYQCYTYTFNRRPRVCLCVCVQLRLAFHNDDQSSHTLTVDSRTTVSQVCELLVQCNHAVQCPHWTIIERLGRFQLGQHIRLDTMRKSPATGCGSIIRDRRRGSVVGGLSLIYAWSMVDAWPLCG